MLRRGEQRGLQARRRVHQVHKRGQQRPGRARGESDPMRFLAGHSNARFILPAGVLQVGGQDGALQARGRQLHLLSEHDQLVHEQGESTSERFIYGFKTKF